MALNHDDMQQINHIARLAVLAMCARGVAASEFENPEVQAVRITLFRSVSIRARHCWRAMP